ncbi:hypothetical protein [Cupriavidus sp. DF5525]|uniref:hypothetical protein n=1 Tax=Cupriavidus sp. DF5525 TaxID=3160989 RepID=UPI0032E013F8
MTAQIPETLYMDEKLAMCSEPLNQYFTLSGNCPAFRAECTALWRGYVGTWEIVNERLYLIGLDGTTEDDEHVSLTTLFPDYPHRVFAHWFDGRIRVPQDGLLNYVHATYASEYERDLLIDFEKGVVTAATVQHNGIAANSNGSSGYSIGAMTMLGPSKANQEDTQ